MAKDRSLVTSRSERAAASDGMYMIGQVAALRRNTCSMRDLHETVSSASVAFLRQTDTPARAGTKPCVPRRAT